MTVSRRSRYLIGWGYVAIAAALLYRAARPDVYATPPHGIAQYVGTDGMRWFDAIKPKCNTLEAHLAMQNNPPPGGWEGAGYGAACYALAGRIADARRLIDATDGDDRHRAAGIVFDVGHPIADAGDDESAGPIMELVISYWPNHYMALYHAGIAEYRTGQFDRARSNLTAFLREYKQDDGWTASARQTLKAMDE